MGKSSKNPAKIAEKTPAAKAPPPGSALPVFADRFAADHGRAPCILVEDMSGLRELDEPLCEDLPGKQRVMVQLMGGGRGVETDGDGVGFCGEMLASPTNYQAACVLERLCKKVGKEGKSPMLIASYGAGPEGAEPCWYEDRVVWA